MDYIDLVKRGNRAVHVNPAKTTDIHLTEHGSDFLWSVFSVFALMTLIYASFYFYLEFSNASQFKRYTFAAPFLISLFLSLSYFTWASNLGWCSIQAEFRSEDVYDNKSGKYPNVRQIFYCKYIAWVFVWPIQLFLIEVAGISINQTEQVNGLWEMIHSLLIQIIGYEYWILSILVGSLIHSTYKWGYWTVGICVQLFILFLHAKRQIGDLRIRGFTLIMYCTAIICILLYNVCWGLADGGNAITVDSDAVFYGILDWCIFWIWTGYLVFIIWKYGEWPEVENYQQHSATGYNPNNDLENNNYQGAGNKEMSPDSMRASGETAFDEDSNENVNLNDEDDSTEQLDSSSPNEPMPSQKIEEEGSSSY